MGEYWNEKFIKSKYIWGLEASTSAKIVMKDLEKRNITDIKLVDLACGYGRDVNYYRKNGAEAWGIDFSQEAISIGKEQWSDMEIVYGDVFQYPFKKKYVNVVTCNFFIHLLNKEKRKELIDIIYDLLPNGGIAYFTVSSEQDCDFALGEIVGENLVKNSRGVVKFYYNRKFILDEFKKFDEIEIEVFTEKHTHDYEHEHINYFIKCKK